MIYSMLMNNIVAVENHLILQFLCILFNFVMFDHYDHEVHCVQELVQIVVLVWHDITRDIRVVDFQASGEMPFLALQQLKSRTSLISSTFSL